MSKVKLTNGEMMPVEMHKVRIVQKLELLDVQGRKEAIEEAGFNTFLLKNKKVFGDMLTDSGVNAMSDLQQSAMLMADDSYAGSETFYRLEATLQDIFGKKYFLPAHQGRACENIISSAFVKEGQFVPMNYHFTTSAAHINVNGGEVLELITDEGIKVTSDELFKGNMDIDALKSTISEKGSDKIAYVRMEAGTNLIGGQPFSVANLREVKKVCAENNIMLVLDASLLQDNLHFIKVREEEFKDATIREITKEIADLVDILYFSARKLGAARGGVILTDKEDLTREMREFVTLYEGFLTYGGMSVREMEAMRVGLEETMDPDIISQGPDFIEYMSNELAKRGVPVVTPSGGLGCHIDAMKFMEHLPREEYRAGSLAAAVYIASGARGMERGTMSENRDKDGNDVLSSMELLRMALPRRVFTLSQINFVVDRIAWLYENRQLIGGLKFVDEPKIMRFFFGRLEATSDWPQVLADKYTVDFGESL